MATKLKITNLPEGFQSIITNGKHSIVGDEPIENTGTDLGLMPLELTLSGLALCKVATMRGYARKKEWNIGNITAEFEQEVGRGNKMLKTQVKIKFDIEGDVTDEQKQELIKQADNCFVHRMLSGEWEIVAE